MNFALLGGLGDERILPASGTIRIAGMQTTTCSRTEKKVKKKKYLVCFIDAFCSNYSRSRSMQQCKLSVLQQTCGLLFSAMRLRLWNKLSVLSRGDVCVQWTNVQKLLSTQERDLWNACQLYALSPRKLCRYVFFKTGDENDDDERSGGDDDYWQ